MPPRPDNAFLIGAMKAGTTSLFLMLRDHPDMCGPFKKEPNTLLDPDCVTDAQFLAAFPGLKPTHRYVLDGSTSYSKKFGRDGVLDRIKALSGKTHLIYILRNPFDRLRSHFYHNIARFPEGIAQFGPAEFGHCLNVSRYSEQLKAFEAAGLTKHMLLLDFEDLVADPMDTYRRTLDFLGLDMPKSLPAMDPKNVNSTAKDQDHLLDWDTMRDKLTREQRILRETWGFRPRTPWLLD